MAKYKQIRLFEPADGCTVPLLARECRAFFVGEFSPDGKSDLDRPLGVRFRSDAGAGAVLCLRDADGQEHRAACEGGEARVYFLKAGMRYEWHIEGPGGRSRARSFLTEKDMPRWVWIPGVSNARDVGGHAVRGGGRMRQGLLYRSSEWNSHKKLEKAGEDILLEQLGVRTEIDLRGMYDDAWPAVDTRRMDWKQFSVDSYADMLKGSSAKCARALFACLAKRETYPAVIHCWGGMDRTATAAALVQALCGVPYEEIERDYTASSLSAGGVRTPEYGGYPRLKELLLSFPGDEERSAREALRGIGVTDGEMDAVRRYLRDGS